MGAYDPHSIDAMLSRIIQRLDAQDRAAAEHRIEVTGRLEEIHSDVRQAHGRVGKLETWQKEITSKAVVIAGLVSAGVAAAWQWWLTHISSGGGSSH